MKISLLKKFARKKQEKIVAKACAEYYAQEGGIDDQTLDILMQMCYNLEVKDRDQVMSTIVFAQEYASKNFKEPEPAVKYTKAEDREDLT